MRWLIPFSALLVTGLVVLNWNSAAADKASPPSKDKPVGIQKRVPWTTSRVKGSPEPPAPYRSEIAFPKLKFAEPLDLTGAPGSDRLFVAERRGKIYSFPNNPKTDKADLLLDLKTTVYALTFHPQFAKNGYMYVTYVIEPERVPSFPGVSASTVAFLGTRGTGGLNAIMTYAAGTKDFMLATKVARFEVSRDNPPSCDRQSEKLIFEWPSGGHNGGCLKFGPDGFLYIVTGDGSGIADELQTGQDLSDVLASILRIDVDHPENGKAYRIPKDNPFVNVKGARPEIWAYGVRQSWRMSFDRLTGDLWAGEVGQDLWEMILKIVKGGNYGWSINEGNHPFRPERKKGPSPILPPIVEHPHSDFRSITGGYVYRGTRLKELSGAYVYADYDTGRVWALRHDGKKVTYHQELIDTSLRIVSFGEDNAGEIYHVDFIGGAIHRLVPAPKTTVTTDFPRKLSETGLFVVADGALKKLQPAPGLIPYSVNSPLWSDHAIKERYLALPGTSQIDFNAIEYPQPAPGAPRGWRFPDGTVLVKTFVLELEHGNPASRRRLETRLLHFEQLAGTEEVGDQYWRGYTYVWNDEQTDAVLLDARGLDRTFTIRDPQAQGGERKQTWHFPSRAECTLCHTMPAKFALGVNTLQMNKDHDYGGVIANQLRTLEHLGIFTKPLPESPEKLPRLVDHENEKLDLNLRARAYLHSNCAHCHMKWGGGNAEFQLLATLPLNELGIVNTRPGHGTFDLADPRDLVPGHPERSMIAYRMTKLGLGRMPHVASSVVDDKAVKMIQEWIKRLPVDGKGP